MRIHFDKARSGLGRTVKKTRLLGGVTMLVALTALGGCGSVPFEETERVLSREEKTRAEQGSIFGGDGINLFGADEEGGGPTGIGVNGFLWRASLDTISFMPLASADPFGGVIITDWYSQPSSPLERFKMTIYILDRKLRADGLKVAVFRQTRVAPNAGWNDAAVASTTPTELENSILTRARQLHVAAADSAE